MTLHNIFPAFPHHKNRDEYFFFEGENFINNFNKKEKLKILEFSINKDGWTEDLTKMADHHISINHPIDIASRDLCIEFLEKYETSSQKIVLEIGCSSGNLIKKIIELKKYNYIGSDAIKKNIKKLSNLYTTTPFVIFDLLKNPFKKATCNALIMLNVLEHIKDDLSALNEANNLLIKGGILIIEVPSGKFLYDNYDKELMHFRRYNMSDIIAKIENAGFKIEKKTHTGFFIFPLFILVKFFNKFFKRKDTVIKQAKLSNNFFLKILFNLEKKFRNFTFPFGVKCYICSRKK